MNAANADRLFVNLERNEPAPGQLLIAAPNNPMLTRSVILIIAHNGQVITGVDLTNRSDVAVFNVLPQWLELVAKPQALYIGGPLHQQSVLGLCMTAPGVDITAQPLLSKLAPRLAYIDMRADPQEIKPLVTGVRLLAGFVEWTAAELQEEINAGDWYVAPALPQDALTPGGVDLWADVMKRQPLPLPLFANFPADVRAN